MASSREPPLSLNRMGLFPHSAERWTGSGRETHGVEQIEDLVPKQGCSVAQPPHFFQLFLHEMLFLRFCTENNITGANHNIDCFTIRSFSKVLISILKEIILRISFWAFQQAVVQ